MKRFECLHCGSIYETHGDAALCCSRVSAKTTCSSCGKHTSHPFGGDASLGGDQNVPAPEKTLPGATILYVCQNCGSFYHFAEEAVLCCAACQEVDVPDEEVAHDVC